MEMEAVMIRNKKIKSDNRGAAIITVIIVCVFISVIATTMLYITSRNFMTKQVDYQNKTSFYEAEYSLDKLKACLVCDVNEAFEYAYSDTLCNGIDHIGSPNIDSYYAESYTKKLESMWIDRESSADASTDPCTGTSYGPDPGTLTPLTLATRSFMYEELMNHGTDEDTAKRLVSYIVAVDHHDIPPAKDKFVIAGIKVAYEPDGSGYSTYISTDIGLELPALYLQEMAEPNADRNAGEVVQIADCVKYMNWKRYED